MEVIETETLPIRVWADEIGEADGVFEQARNLANHPIARRWVALMPDFHIGYGMPIGGVIATEGGVIPNAVGVDIGCGMIAARTHLAADQLDAELLQKLREAIHARVPVGFASHATARVLPAELRVQADECVVVRGLLDKASAQAGTLGSGNHFIEIQRDAQDAVWIMLHSGSRNVGLQVCNHYHGLAKDLMENEGIAVPHVDLAYLPAETSAFGEYLADMRWCMAFAEVNRQFMFEAVCDAIDAVLGEATRIDVHFDTHHNFAQMELHDGAELLIHRKGAVRAEGLVTIPGSMGTGSYIGEGKCSPRSFETCSHGAGRKLSRKEANRVIGHERAVESMKHVVYGVRQGDYDEMPDCYKDIDDVMRQQADLVSPVYKLLPMAVVKG